MKAYTIIAFANPSENGLREGIAVAETEEEAVAMCDDPSAVAFPISLAQCCFQTPRFEWTRNNA